MPGKLRTVIRFERAETRTIKTIAIGAGVMGASVAYRLAQTGAAAKLSLLGGPTCPNGQSRLLKPGKGPSP